MAMLVRLSVALPLLVRVTLCCGLDCPTCRLGKLRLVLDKASIAIDPSPIRLMKWGEPAPLSSTRIDPNRGPGAVGVNVTVNVQVAAAATPVPQLSVSLKSPLMVIDVMVSGALPILRSKEVLGWLTEPTGRIENGTSEGLIATAGAIAVPIFATKASVFPPIVFCSAAAVTGKSLESV